MRGSPLVWRHTCVIADFIEVSFCLLSFFVFVFLSFCLFVFLSFCREFQGRTALFENGQKYYDESGIKSMMETYQKNKKEIDIVSVGWVEDVHFAGPV